MAPNKATADQTDMTRIAVTALADLTEVKVAQVMTEVKAAADMRQVKEVLADMSKNKAIKVTTDSTIAKAAATVDMKQVKAA